MFSLSSRSSWFSSLFASMPVLWMDWDISLRREKPFPYAYNCCKNIWTWYLATTGKALPVRLNSHVVSYNLPRLLMSLPWKSLPCITQLSIFVPMNIGIQPFELHGIISLLSSLRTLAIDIANCGDDMDSRWWAWIPVGESIHPVAPTISLRLSGVVFTRSTVSRADLSAVQVLTLSNIDTEPSEYPVRLSDILRLAPRLSSLVLHFDARRRIDGDFWVAPRDGFSSLVSLLEYVEISADVTTSTPFLRSFTLEKHGHLRAVKSNAFCYRSTGAWAVCNAIPAFREELALFAGTVDFREGPLTLITERPPNATHPLRWVMQWTAVDDEEGEWVCMRWCLYAHSRISACAWSLSLVPMLMVSRLLPGSR